MTAAHLADRLQAGDFGLAFYWPQHDMTIERIWAEPGNPPLLEALIDDRSAPTVARLLAAEALFRNDFTFIDRHDNTEIARIYADAMVHRHTPNANLWGLLWFDNSVGELGGRFVILAESSIPALLPLLDDDTVVDWYEGSEEATVGNRARYRIEDFAAFYLGRIVRHPIAFHDDPAARDAEIASLRAAVAARQAAAP